MTVIADTGFLVALLSRRDGRHAWAADEATRQPRPWHTCEPVLAEAFHILREPGVEAIMTLLDRGGLVVSFSLAEQQGPVLALMRKFADVPMSLADACLVRMTEIMADPLVLTTDLDFRTYRRHGRQVVPCMVPPSA